MNFDDFNLDPAVLDGIRSMGYKTPTPIQQQAIPIILQDKDLIACAQTGTGKTAAFVLPLLHKIFQTPPNGINTLILVPTRELAIQIDQQIEAMSYFIDVRSIAVYGGGSGNNWTQQKKALVSGADIIIATPGRLIAQMQMGGLDFSQLRHLVLDEADRMLDMGFSDDILRIIRTLPPQRQTLCFSATMPPKIRAFTRNILHNPQQISISISKPAEGIRQLAYLAYDEQKLKLLSEILKDDSFHTVILFSSSRDKVKKIESSLRRSGVQARAFHSDLNQEQREALMQDFKNQKIRVMVGTDILSRGIDVEGIDLVINYDVPHDAEDYVHRIGRTARAANTGTAITFINDKDQRKFAAIERMIEKTVEKVPLPAAYGSAPEYQPEKFRSGGNRQARPKGSGKGSGQKREWNKKGPRKAPGANSQKSNSGSGQ